jgi:hypothetical protein
MWCRVTKLVLSFALGGSTRELPEKLVDDSLAVPSLRHLEANGRLGQLGVCVHQSKALERRVE